MQISKERHDPRFRKASLTVSRLAILFMEHAEREYRRDGKPTGEADNFCQALIASFHGVHVVDFRPTCVANSSSAGNTG